MVGEETARIVAALRRTGIEPADIEAKASVGKLPRSVPETLSAFANGAGGTLLLGLSERDGFRPAEGFDARATYDAVAGACSDKVSPPLRDATIEIVELEGAHLVRVDVEELDPLAKPCFVLSRGEYNGSYIRGGDGDRRLSRYEVSQLLANRGQPEHDREPVLEATEADLDTEMVNEFLRSVRARGRRFAEMERGDLLHQMGVLVTTTDGSVHPSLAGLLSLGSYPQQFFPQLFVSFVALPGLTMGDTTPDGRRFLDNQNLDGSIPAMVEDATYAAIRNMRKAAIIQGMGREDRYDYPLDVIRELVVNALMHRDYSPEARGSQVQIEIYPDRLEVKSPGGLHGPITTDVLGTPEQRSTSRNALLAKLLTDIPMPQGRGEAICENRGSGLRAVMTSLRRVGMSPPDFRVVPDAVDVVVPQHALLSEDVIEWINELGEPGLTDPHYLALAMMRIGGTTSNGMLQTWGVEMHEASKALRDLVARGVATRTGGKRYARYRLAADQVANQAVQGSLFTRTVDDPDDPDGILVAIRAGHVTTRAIAETVNLNYQATLRRLNRLIVQDVLERTDSRNSPTQTYRIVNQGE